MRFEKGSIPYNKGIQKEEVLNKVQRFKNNLAVFCKKHGEHLNWRLHTGNNVQCKLCCNEIQKKAREENKLKFKLKDAKQHSKTKNISFEINEKIILEILKIQNNKCALSGIDFVNENYSIDKINPKMGYTKDNIQLVIFEVNRMKSDLDLDLFLDLCNKISLYKINKTKKK